MTELLIGYELSLKPFGLAVAFSWAEVEVTSVAELVDTIGGWIAVVKIRTAPKDSPSLFWAIEQK